jgi:hypothetical protein
LLAKGCLINLRQLFTFALREIMSASDQSAENLTLDEFVTRWNAHPQRELPFAQMSHQQLLDTIAEHEITNRGIDWRSAAEGGSEGMRAAGETVRAHVDQLVACLTPAERTRAAGLGLLDVGGRASVLNALTAGPSPLPIPPSARPYPCWFWNADRAAVYAGLTGDAIKSNIAQLVAQFQVMANNDDVGIVRVMMQLAIYGFGQVGITAVARIIQTLVALTEATEAYAVFRGVIEVGKNVIRLAISTFVLAVLVPIVLLMGKDASAIMLLINNTANDLVLKNLYCQHGRVVGIFEKEVPVPPAPPQAIIPGIFSMYNPPTQRTINTVAAGFFMAQKKPGALIGTAGAFQFHSTSDFPSGINVGWSVPLEFGRNSALVDANKVGDLENFADQADSKALQRSSSKASTGAVVTANVNSASGSEGYMIVNFAPAA